MWFKPRLKKIGIEENDDKTVCQLPQLPEQRAPPLEAHRVHEWASEALGGTKVVAAAGSLLVGCPIGSREFIKQAVQDIIRDPAADTCCERLS